jgi:hypothetical protein
MVTVRKKLTDIFGNERALDDKKILYEYARDQSFAPGRKPDFVVFPESVDEIQQTVRLANETSTPVIPYSSGLNLHGAALPDHGGIILNLSRMNNILEIDKNNWFVVVEPGVTYQQLQQVLMQNGFRLMIPFGVPPGRSALTSYLERDPVMAAPSFEYGNFLSGGRPGGTLGPIRNHIFRLWTGAQGTLGIMTKMVIAIYPYIRERKIFFFSFNDLTEAIEPIKRIQRKQIGTECFLLNRFNMAVLLSDEWQVPDVFPAGPRPSHAFENFQTILPPWILTLCLNGSPRYPEEKIAYEEKALREVCDELRLELKKDLPGAEHAGGFIMHEIFYPWSILKKFNYRGSVHDLSFKSPLKRIADLDRVIHKLCDAYGYDRSAIGAYLLPMERGRAVHCEFDLHCDPEDRNEVGMVKSLWLKASEALMNQGAFFDRPYGAWAEMVFRRSGNHTVKLKEIKREMDPRGILNPGKLCF